MPFDYSGNFIYRGILMTDIIVKMHLGFVTDGTCGEGIPRQFPIVSCGGVLVSNPAPSEVFDTTSGNYFTTPVYPAPGSGFNHSTGELGTLNNKESGFYNIYFKFIIPDNNLVTDISKTLFQDQYMTQSIRYRSYGPVRYFREYVTKF